MDFSRRFATLRAYRNGRSEECESLSLGRQVSNPVSNHYLYMYCLCVCHEELRFPLYKQISMLLHFAPLLLIFFMLDIRL